VLFLASDESRNISGHLITVAGANDPAVRPLVKMVG
jgi:hypothetical protein